MFILLAGCAADIAANRRYVWPPLPDEPKVEWLGTYSSKNSFPKSGAQRFAESIVGGEDTERFEKPWGVASDGKGKVYVADTVMPNVMVYDFVNNDVHVIGKGEHDTGFKGPIGVALDGSGNVYVSDSKTNKIYVFASDERPLSVISDNVLNWPAGMTVDDKRGRLYVANVHADNIVVFDLSGKYLFSIGKGGDRDGKFNYPTDVDLDSEGNLVVADSMNARVQILDPDGKFLRKFGHRGDGLTDFQVIKGVAVDRKTDNVYVTDGRAHRFLIFNKSGESLLSVGGVGSGGPGAFMVPQDIFIESSGRFYVVDSLNRRFQIFQIVDEEWKKMNPYK